MRRDLISVYMESTRDEFSWAMGRISCRKPALRPRMNRGDAFCGGDARGGMAKEGSE